MRDDRLRLHDILEAIEQVEKYAARGQEAFLRDELIQIWIVHHIQIIGEAARSLSLELREEHPEIPWPRIGAMRNVLVHQYFGIDVTEVWRTVENDLTPFKQQVRAILEKLSSEPDG